MGTHNVTSTTWQSWAQTRAVQPPALQPACSAIALRVAIDTTAAAGSSESRHVADSTGARAAKLVSGQRGSIASSSRAATTPPLSVFSVETRETERAAVERKRGRRSPQAAKGPGRHGFLSSRARAVSVRDQTEPGERAAPTCRRDLYPCQSSAGAQARTLHCPKAPSRQGQMLRSTKRHPALGVSGQRELSALPSGVQRRNFVSQNSGNIPERAIPPILVDGSTSHTRKRGSTTG